MEAPGETTVTDTQILWKEGKVCAHSRMGWLHAQCCLCQDITARNSVESDGTGRKRVLEEQPSFFSWFSADSGMEEPGEIIRDDIYPNPLQFYLASVVVQLRVVEYCTLVQNPAALNETYDDEEEEEEEEEEDGLDEEEEEDEDPVSSEGYSCCS